MTRFKICGLRDVTHAVAAAEAGAGLLGFNFVPGVRRQISEERALDIIDEYRRLKGGGGPLLVALFANQPLEDVNRIVKRCGLDAAQLCGDEPPEYWDRVDALVIRQIKVRDSGSRHKAIAEVLRRVDEVVSRAHIALLDKYEAGSLGGTGRTFDWSVAAEVAKRHRFIMAGGLSPENVSQAIAAVGPWAVDVSSGVETHGVKDPDKIVAFAQQVCGEEGQGESHGAKDHRIQ